MDNDLLTIEEDFYIPINAAGVSASVDIAAYYDDVMYFNERLRISLNASKELLKHD
jgi:hypothetical protein